MRDFFAFTAYCIRFPSVGTLWGFLIRTTNCDPAADFLKSSGVSIFSVTWRVNHIPSWLRYQPRKADLPKFRKFAPSGCNCFLIRQVVWFYSQYLQMAWIYVGWAHNYSSSSLRLICEKPLIGQPPIAYQVRSCITVRIWPIEWCIFRIRPCWMLYPYILLSRWSTHCIVVVRILPLNDPSPPRAY